VRAKIVERVGAACRGCCCPQGAQTAAFIGRAAFPVVPWVTWSSLDPVFLPAVLAPLTWFQLALPSPSRSTIHFYNLKSSLSSPQMMVVAEIDDPFVPVPDDLLVNLRDSRPLVHALLDSLPTSYGRASQVQGPAVSAVSSPPAAGSWQSAVGTWCAGRRTTGLAGCGHRGGRPAGSRAAPPVTPQSHRAM
jgi:hypothetical protein